MTPEARAKLKASRRDRKVLGRGVGQIDSQLLDAIRRRPDAWTIEPRAPGVFSQMRELRDYRYLFRFFAMRAVEKRYMRTILGVWWLLIRPLFPIVLSVFVFGNVMGVRSEGLPYFLFMLAGMSQWRMFSASLMWCTRSLEMNRGVMKQLYFPRLIVPISTVAPALVDFLIYVGIIVLTIGYYYFASGTMYLVAHWETLLSILAVALTLILALSIGLFLSVWGAETRDLRFSLGYILNFWMLLTPVVYPLDYVDPRWRWLLLLNPMASYVETFKFGLFGLGEMDWNGFGVAVLLTFAIAVAGLRFFHGAQASSTDRV